MKHHYIPLGIVAIALASCTQPGQPSTTEGQRAFNPLGLPFNNGLYGYLQTYVHRDMGDGADHYQSQAIFYNTSGIEVPASAAALNGSALTHGDNAYYTESSIGYDGTNHIWAINGNTDVPSFTDTIVSPYHFSITAPNYLSDSVSVGSGFTITYGSPHTDSVLVAIEYDALLSTTIDSSIHHPYRHFAAWVPNTGSFSVPSTALSGWPTDGVIYVAVGARNEKIATVLGKPMLLRSISATTTSLFLKP